VSLATHAQSLRPRASAARVWTVAEKDWFVVASCPKVRRSKLARSSLESEEG